MGKSGHYALDDRLESLGEAETRAVLKELAAAHRALAELNATAAAMPNQDILISTLALQEARDSSAIENIITTQDDLYRSDIRRQAYPSLAAKKVHNYVRALRTGFERVRATGLLTTNDIITIQAMIEENDAGFRKLPGTELRNDSTGQTVYVPPQHPQDIVSLMSDLERFINSTVRTDLDPLTRMSLIHHRFESIHPFYDGNGRTGRLINVLYLVKEKLLGSPVLYLSRYINRRKADYYRLLQSVRDTGDWEPWLLFMIRGIEETSAQTTALIQGIKAQMQTCKVTIKAHAPRLYSHDLLNNIFRYPYTKIDFLVEDLGVTRKTASKYLEALVALGVVRKIKAGKENYYLNTTLLALLSGPDSQ